MDVRLSYGIYAGEIREMEPTVARELIAAGRATDPYAEQPAKELSDATGQLNQPAKHAKSRR